MARIFTDTRRFVFGARRYEGADTMRRLSMVTAFAATLLLSATVAQAQNVVITWNNAALAAIQATNTPPTVVSRALAMVHTSMFDAWAAYDTKAIGSLPNSPARQPASAATPDN